MSDLFSLAPEGQAWADDKAANNVARPEDYDPGFFQGAISAPLTGVAEGTIGLAQSAVSFSKRLISELAFTEQIAPTVNLFRAMFPDADKQLNEAYDSLGARLKEAREFVKPDAGSQGTAAQVLHGLGQFAPAIAATAVGGPAVGAAAAFGTTYEQTYQDFKDKGVDEQTARSLAATQSGLNAAGMALPAAVGSTLLTRIASGIGINTAFGGVGRFAVGDTLEEKGYTDLAKQYRFWDAEAMLVDSVLGAAFGGAHHLAARNAAVPETPATPDVEAPPTAQEGGDLNPDRSRQLLAPRNEATPETAQVKPSDIDAAHALNEGHYYDIESAPVLHGTHESINSHVAAMDEAARQIMNGQPVNVSMQARGLDGPVRPGLLDAAAEQYNAMEQLFRENGIRYDVPQNVVNEAPAPRGDSAFTGISDEGGQVSVDPDTGQTLSSNSYDLLAARDMATANPEMTIAHPDTGQPVTLAEALADFDTQIATVQKESKVYSVAAACFLRNP